MTTIAFAGGASGGHLTPALAICEQLPPGFEPLFLSCGRPIEREMLAGFGDRYRALPHDAGRAGASPLERLRNHRTAVRAAKGHLVKSRATGVFGLGSYASIPGVLAASELSLPIVLLEQNAVPGQATELLAPLAARTLVALPLATSLPRSTVIGNPVRTDFRGGRSPSKCLLVLGGSQGAATLNRQLPRLLASCPLEGWTISHQCGRGALEETKTAYAAAKLSADVFETSDNLAEQLAKAGIVVCRAGASTLFELAASRVPAVLVPDPNAIRDHQSLNAAAAGVDVCEERHLDRLPERLRPLLTDRRLRAWRSHQIARLDRPDAASEAVRTMLRLIERRSVAA